MIDLATEQVYSLTDAPSRFPFPTRRNGKKPHVATLFRWAKTGCRGVRLETIRVGGTTCTSTEAINRFCERLTERPRIGSPRPTPTGQRKAAERASRELDAIGI